MKVYEHPFRDAPAPSWMLRDVRRLFPCPSHAPYGPYRRLHRLTELIDRGDERDDLDWAQCLRLYELLKLLVRPQIVEFHMRWLMLTHSLSVTMLVSFFFGPLIDSLTQVEFPTLGAWAFWRLATTGYVWMWVHYLIGDSYFAVPADLWDDAPLRKLLTEEYNGCEATLARDLSLLHELDPKLITRLTVYRLSGLMLDR